MIKKLFVLAVAVLLLVPMGVLAEDNTTTETYTCNDYCVFLNYTEGICKTAAINESSVCGEGEFDAGNSLGEDPIITDCPTGEPDNETQYACCCTTEEEEPEDPGVTPDSFLWGIDVALDRISYFLTINPEARAQKGLEIAQERLLEIRAMAEAGEIGPMGKAQNAHSMIMIKIKGDIDDLDGDDGTNESDLDEIEEEMNSQFMYMQKIKLKIRANSEISEDVKLQFMEKYKDMEGSSEELKIKIMNKKNMLKIKIKQKIKMAGEEEPEEPEEPGEGNESEENESEGEGGELTAASVKNKGKAKGKNK